MTNTVDTNDLYVEARGPADAPVGVLIHSAGVVGADLVDMFGLTIPGYRVLAPHRTNYEGSRRSRPGGTGRSNGQLPDVAMIEDDADAIATMLGTGGHLFGYSYGGIVALTIAAQHPELVRSLALLEPPAFQVAPDDPDIATTRARMHDALFTGRHDDPDEYFRAFMTGAFGDNLRIPLDMIPRDRKEAAMREQVPWDPDIDFGAIAGAGIPTLVITGDWDPGMRAVARHLVTTLSARHVEYAGADHFFMDDWNDIARELEAHWSAANPG